MRVTVQLPFTHAGRPVVPGMRIEVAALEATVLRRRGYITLSDNRQTRDLDVEPAPESAPITDPSPPLPLPRRLPEVPGDLPEADEPDAGSPDEDDRVELPSRRRNRTYKRRDMTVEPDTK